MFVCLLVFLALAEIISKRQDSDGAWEFYVHYLNCEPGHILFLVLDKITCILDDHVNPILCNFLNIVAHGKFILWYLHTQ